MNMIRPILICLLLCLLTSGCRKGGDGASPADNAEVVSARPAHSSSPASNPPGSADQGVSEVQKQNLRDLGYMEADEEDVEWTPPTSVKRAAATTPPKPHWDGARRNLIIITLDTVRADHLSCYGAPEGTTPNIDALADHGVLFENMHSQTNQTNPSHTTIMTGVMGIEHGILDNKTVLPDNADTLPEAFKRAGYATAGFPATNHTSSWFGWRGFDHIYMVEPLIKNQLNAEQITDRVIAWIDENPGKPFFIWAHYFDAHAPYHPPKEFQKRFYPKNPKLGDATPINDAFPSIAHYGWLKDVRDIDYPKALYMAEIAFIDEQIGRLLKHLDDKSLTDGTGVVLTADHGENLGELEQYFNHYFILESTLRVPLIMRMPGLASALRVPQRATHVDIAPTLAELYGVDLQNVTRGVSLVPTLKGSANPALEARTEFIFEHGNNRQVAFRQGDLKVIFTITEFDDKPPVHVGANEVWVFDLAKDPQEKNNIKDQHAALIAKYEPMARQWFDLKQSSRGGGDDDDGHGHDITPAQKRNLEALGYVDDDDEEEQDEAPARAKAPAAGGSSDPAGNSATGDAPAGDKSEKSKGKDKRNKNKQKDDGE